MNCPNCLAELPMKERALFFACPKCNFLLLENGNKIRQVNESDIIEKYQQVGKLQRWICLKIVKHEWSGQGYIMAVYKEACIKSRVCMRCFERDTTLEKHEFKENYLDEGSCEVNYICQKCGVQKNEKWRALVKSHAFGEWIVDDRKPCIKNRTCQRCGFMEKKAEHSGRWIDLGRTSTVKYIERRTCNVCGEQEDRDGHWESPWA